MKRDMDLVRKILFKLEKDEGIGSNNFSIEGYDWKTINFHIYLMNEAGFLEAVDISSHGDMFERIPRNITWQGYEFLDLIRKDNAWNKAKDQMKKTGGMAFEVLLKVLIDIAIKSSLNGT